MIVEIAQLTIRPGSERQFEAAFLTAIKVLGGGKGYSISNRSPAPADAARGG
jgi:hypothetical protein